jgi:ABC-type branched-subunit amino acid transport system substrate-binding protein
MRSRRLVGAALLLPLLVGVAACGDDDDSGSSADTTVAANAGGDGSTTTAGGGGSSADVELPAELNADACDSTQGITDDSITIGVLTDLSGPVSAGGGIDIGESFKAHFAAVNAAGGIDGRQVNVDVEDMKYDPVATASAYEGLRSDVAMMPIILSSAGIEAVAQDMEDDCLITLEGGPNGQLSQKYPTVFTPTTSIGHDVMNAISYVLEDKPDATFALALQSDATGNQTKTAAEYAEQNAGITVKGTVEFAAADTDLTAQIQELVSLNADYVIFGGGVPNQLAALVSGIDAANADSNFLVPTSGWSPNVLSTAAAPAIEKRVTVFSSYGAWSGDAPGLVTMRDELDQFSDRDIKPGAPPLLGYETALVAEAVLRQWVASDDLTLGGLYKAALTVNEFDSEGVAPPLSYGREDEPRIPSTASRPYKTDAATDGGLIPLTDDYLDSELNQGYVEPAAG